MRRTRKTLSTLSILVLAITYSPEAFAEDVRLIDVVSVTWASAPALKASVADVEASINSDVNRNWRRFTSLEGDTRDRTISFQLGKTLSSPIVVNRAMACDGPQSLGFMESIRPIAYERLGIKDLKNRYLIILAANNNCIWSGRAIIGSAETLGGTITLHDTASSFVITHELGHTLGLGHSNFLRCSSGAFDGPWGRDCRAVEYGGTIDVMGNVETESGLSTYHQWRLGLLEEDGIKQSWLNEKIELTASDIYGGVRAIFLRDGNSTYWIEYRRPKENYGAGLAIYRTDPPPSSLIISPNAQDLENDFGDGVAADIWMLNWDSYNYSGSRASGSMTHPKGRIATFFSNNVAVSAEPVGSDGRKVLISINRKADTTPPPTPVLTEPETWSFPGEKILQRDFTDGESVISGFEALVDKKLTEIEPSEDDEWSPSYLNPIVRPKSLHLRDLPEGSYSLQVRAIDIWGNVSQWSEEKFVRIDRGEPVVLNEFRISAVDKKEVEVTWSGAMDIGSGLCETIIYNQEGWITQRSVEVSSPKLRFPIGRSSVANTQLYDCVGNGKIAQLSLDAQIITAESRRGRTGTWGLAPKAYGSGALRCFGRCSMTFTAEGEKRVLIGDGTSDVFVSGRKVFRIPNSNSGEVRTSEKILVGPKKKVIRVQGSNFVLIGLGSIKTEVKNVDSIDKLAQAQDLSLLEITQKELSNLGFRSGDFTSDWTLLPMTRGTTLLDPTLDLCGGNYQSESGREYRRQVTANKVGSPYLFLSTEVVKYKDKDNAVLALSELKDRLSSCMKNGGFRVGETFTQYSFRNLPNHKGNLIKDDSKVIFNVTIASGSTTIELLAFYLFRYQFFTGLYIVKPGVGQIDEGESIRWFNVAERMAQRLFEYTETKSA